MARQSSFTLLLGAKDNTRGALRSASRGINRLGTNAQAAGRLIGTALAFTGITLGVRGVQRLSDEYITLSNRVKLFTDSNAQAAAVQQELFDLSNRTRSSVSATAQVYQRLAQANTQLGLSQADILEVTENINKAVRVSGVEAASATQALIQLGQGIASGQLRGQELNSVLEQTPRVALQIANELGAGIGQIRQLAIEGRITSDVIISAFQNVGELDAEFAQLGITFGEAFTVIQNEALRAVGAVTDFAGGANGAATAVRDIGVSFARNLGTFAINTIIELQVQTRNWVTGLNQAVEGVKSVASALAGLGGGGLSDIVDIFQNLPASIRFVAELIGIEIAASVRTAALDFERLGVIAKAAFDIATNPFSAVRVYRETGEEVARINGLIEQNKQQQIEANDAASERLKISKQAQDDARFLLEAEREIGAALRDQNRARELARIPDASNLPTPMLDQAAVDTALRDAAAFVKERFEEILQTQDISILGGNQLNIDAFNEQLEQRLERSKSFTTSTIEQERVRQQGILNELQLGLDQQLITQTDFDRRRVELLQGSLDAISQVQIPNTGGGTSGGIFDLIPGLGGGDQAERLDAELATLQEAFDARIQIIRENAAILSEIGIEGSNLELEAARQKEAELARIEKRGIDLRRKQKLDEIRNGLSAARDFASAIITVTGNQNKTLFNIQKAASAAIAVVNTAEGVTKALAKNNFPLAAAIAAAGAAEIATIASTSIGGGSGSRGGVSGGGSLGNDPFDNDENDGFIDTNPAAGTRQDIAITIEGSTFTGDQIRELVEELNEGIGDGTIIRPIFT